MGERVEMTVSSFPCSGFVLGGVRVRVRVHICFFVLLFVFHCAIVSFYVWLCRDMCMCVMLMRKEQEKLLKTMNNGCQPTAGPGSVSSVSFPFSLICK